jgi:hypothetical protein
MVCTYLYHKNSEQTMDSFKFIVVRGELSEFQETSSMLIGWHYFLLTNRKLDSHSVKANSRPPKPLDRKQDPTMNKCTTAKTKKATCHVFVRTAIKTAEI